MRVAVIPARGGSKRIPRKNVRPFHGRPMIAWSIDAALASGCFDRVVVSTDDDEIGACARAAGAEVPFVRPPALSDDHATAIQVVRHAIDALGLTNGQVCCVFATAPLLDPVDLREGLARLLSGDHDYAIAVTRFAFPPQRGLRLLPGGGIEATMPEHRLTRSQDLEPLYHDAAQLVWGQVDAWAADRPVYGPRTVALVVPGDRVQDVDTLEDWARAEALFARRRARFPGGYRILPRPELARGEHTLRAVHPEDIEDIRVWRNAQLHLLRQTAPLTPEDQLAYYETAIWPSMSSAEPANLLLTLREGGRRVGYGGLVHLAWPHRRAEVSFLLDPAISAVPEEHARHFRSYLELVRELAFRDLGLRRLTSETWAFREAHVALLEAFGFRREGVLRGHVLVDGQPVDAILHGLEAS